MQRGTSTGTILRALPILMLASTLLIPRARAEGPMLALHLAGGESAVYALSEVARIGFEGEETLVVVTVGGSEAYATESIARIEFLFEFSSVEDLREAAGWIKAIHLFQSRPNPMRSWTRISFELPQAGEVELSVYGAEGRLVRALLAEEREAGRHGYVTATPTEVRDNLDGSTWLLLDLSYWYSEMQFDGAGSFHLREAPLAWRAYPNGYDPAIHPVTLVTWFGAGRYCDADGRAPDAEPGRRDDRPAGCARSSAKGQGAGPCTLILTSDSAPDTRGRSRMRESRAYGSVRGAPGNRRSYRDRLDPAPLQPRRHPGPGLSDTAACGPAPPPRRARGRREAQSPR